METIVLAGVLIAAALLMASGVWVGVVLIRAVTRRRRPTVTMTREASNGSPLASHPDSGRS